MLPLVLPQLIWALSGAPSLTPYDFDPTDIARPDWTQSLEDSLRSDRPVGFRTVVHDAAGRLIGRDTVEMSLHSGGLYWRRIQWTFGVDTTWSIDENWSGAGSTRTDSLVYRTCKGSSCRVATRLWTMPTPNGRLSVMGYSETAENVFARYDSTLRRTDSRGRRTYSKTWWESPTGSSVDSIEWKDDAPALWTNERISYGTRVLERHHPTWDSTRLVRDSVVRRTTKENGSFTDTTILRACSWVGPRIQSCFSLPDSTITSLVSWSSDGRPLFRGELSGERSVDMSSWLWDERGRLVRTREWGSETDLDSLVYGEGALPERSLLYSCTGDAPGLPDSCTLRKVRTFLYDGPALAIGAPASRTRHIVHTLSGGRVSFQDLGPSAKRVVLMKPDGRILSTATPVSSECTLHRPETPGITFYGILDAKGRMIATGRLPGL